MELQLGLSLHNHVTKPNFIQQYPCHHLTNDDQPPKTLPLLSSNDKSKDHHPPPPPFSTFQMDDDEEDNHPVGWPPIESWRRKVVPRRPQPRQPPPENRRPVQSNSSRHFVKVKMEGIAIIRKLDLNLYHSHHSLKFALISMFSAYQAIDRNGLDFTLIYEDKDGDWLLAQDLPWNSFVESVQRLKILVRKRNRD